MTSSANRITKHQSFLTQQLIKMQGDMDDLSTGGQDVVVSITEATTQPEPSQDQIDVGFTEAQVSGTFSYNPTAKQNVMTQDDIYNDVAELKRIMERLGLTIDVTEIKVKQSAPVEHIKLTGTICK